MERRWRTSKYFNPRSREGSDFFRDPFTFPSSNFNPRSREGSDSLLAFSAAFSSYFNPRSREGSDRANIGSNTRRTEFQSTLPRGERRDCFDWEILLGNFNPRSREGSDVDAAAVRLHFAYFNPRSREGSDDLTCNKPPFWIIFQSTLPRGERRRQQQ